MLYLETIAPSTLALLRRIQSLPELADTRLVGGTALALQLGHRISVDLDLFGYWNVDSDLQVALKKIGQAKRISGTASGKLQFFYIDGIKVDCVTYSEFPWLLPPITEEGVRLASVQDIAAMKINAITNRGTRKDFVDLAFLLKSHTLTEIFQWYFAKYQDASPGLALRSLSYFADAESMPMPKMLQTFDWEQAKTEICASVRALVTDSANRYSNQTI